MSKDAFGDRLKQYERAAEQVLIPGLPIIARLDGNSFSKFTKKVCFKKPFDERMTLLMAYAAKEVLEYCGGQIAYVQSDEITILIKPNEMGELFLGGRTQKLASLLAAKASVAFSNYLNSIIHSVESVESPVFDCRVFQVPEHEVNNIFLWRQQDAFKNCVSAYAHYKFLEKFGMAATKSALLGASTNDRQEFLFKYFNININDLPTLEKRGFCVYKKKISKPIEEILGDKKYQELLEKGHVQPDQVVERSGWFYDYEIPLFSQNTQFVLEK